MEHSRINTEINVLNVIYHKSETSVKVEVKRDAMGDLYALYQMYFSLFLLHYLTGNTICFLVG